MEARVEFRVMHPDVAIRSYRSLGELRASLEASGAIGLYDIAEGESGRRLAGYTAPRWGVAFKDRHGMVELIPDFWRQGDDSL